VVVVASTTPVSNPKELIAYIKENPGKLSFSSSGIGNPQQLAGELMNTMAGTKVLHVPYRGAAPAVNDLLAGTVDTVLLDISILIPHARSGAIKILGITSDTRAPLLPDVPTMREMGYPKVNSDNWYALISPGAAPAEARKKIFDAATAALRTKEIADAYEKVGGVVGGGTTAELQAFLKEEVVKWAAIIKAANVKLE
jgi:tripartite-type tricarboxylate transporter receptor subunit TctC